MTPLQLAWRTTKRYRARTVLAIAGVTVIGALLFDMLLLSHGLLASFADLLASEGFELRVVTHEGFSRVPIPGSAAIAASILALGEVDDVAQIRMEPGSARAAGKQPVRVTIVGRTQSRPGPWRVIAGDNVPLRAAAGDCPIAIGPPLASALDLRPGSPVALTARPGAATVIPPVDCRVSGVVDFGFPAASELTAAMPMDAFDRLTGGDHAGEAELILVALRPGVDVASVQHRISQLRPDLRVYSNEDVVAQFNRNAFAYFRQISAVLSFLTTAFAFLLIATLLTVSINHRLGEIAALRALGIARRRIAAMLLWESALLVGAGAVLALPVGGVLAIGLDHILRQMPGLPERLHFFVFETRALVLHFVVFVVTALAAAAYPIWLSATLPIAPTLRREVVG
jgi:putative ABC transport system permease protein